MSIAPGHREDERRRELGERQAARLEVVRREQDRQRDDRDEQQVEERRQRVDDVGARRTACAAVWPVDDRQPGHDRQADERDRDGRPCGRSAGRGRPR